MSVFADLQALEQEMEELTHKMGELDPASSEYAQVADRYQRISGHFHMNDGYALDSQVGTVLDGLGFKKEDWTRYTEEFSGGWQMRIALGKLLLSKPNLLLLDEPTNHLDLETRNWLEQYLLQYPFAYILISHDRYFLDVTVDRIAEIWNKRRPLLQRQLRKISRAKAGAPRLAGRRLQESARAHRAAGSLHQPLPLPGDEGQAGAEPHQGAGEDRAHRGAAGRAHHPLHLPAAQAQRPDGGRGHRRCARATAPKHVFSGANFTIQRGDRIALVGVNGAGKSTLIKLLTGIEPLTEGKLNLRPQRRAGLFRAGPVQGTRSRTRACWTICRTSRRRNR